MFWDVVAFVEGCLEAVRGFDRILKRTGSFGLSYLSQTGYVRVLTGGFVLDPSWTRGSTSVVLRR